MSSEQASIRFVESFYPSNSGDNHILILSPQAELSPLYAQYLHFAVLEYHYTSWGAPGRDLLGISLDVPSTYLNNDTAFRQPRISDMAYNKNSEEPFNEPQAPSPFVYQGISSSANLIFGDQWTIFHDFLTKRLQAAHSGKNSKTEKLVPESEPAWVEFLLELSRARAWSLLYPASPFVTIHNELARIPEEFQRTSDPEKTKTPPASEHPEEEPYILSAEAPVLNDRVEADTTRDAMALHKMLPFNGELQDSMFLPHLTHEGALVDPFSGSERRDKYVTYFRAAIGGCQGADASRDRMMTLGKTDDLFCLPGVDMRFVDENPTPDKDALLAETIADGTKDSEKNEMPAPTTTSTASSTATSSLSPEKFTATVETAEQLLADQRKLDVS